MQDNRLIVALDVPTAPEALTLAESLGPHVGFYKIGLGMLTTGGLAAAIELKESGKRVFLDMKLFDISNTIENAVAGLAQIGLDFLTVHGDPHVVEAAQRGKGNSDLKILAVTVLTSLDREDLDNAMIAQGDVHDVTLERANRALNAGADGVIASPLEAAKIRSLPAADNKLIVTPGVRPVGADAADQKRIMTPRKAIDAGADHIVVGRPIVQADNPRQAAEDILAQLNRA